MKKKPHTHTHRERTMPYNEIQQLHEYFVVFLETFHMIYSTYSGWLAATEPIICIALIQLALSWKPAVMTCPGDTVSDRIWSHSITHHKRLIIKQAPRFGELHFTLPSFPGQSQVWLIYFLTWGSSRCSLNWPSTPKPGLQWSHCEDWGVKAFKFYPW